VQPVSVWTMDDVQLIDIGAHESTQKRHWSVFTQLHAGMLYINTHPTIDSDSVSKASKRISKAQLEVSRTAL